MQLSFDNRRNDMEMRMQEAQLEQELRWMEQNPGKMPPSWGVPGGSQSIVSKYDTEQFNPGIPSHEAEVKQPINLGIKEEDEPKETKRSEVIKWVVFSRHPQMILPRLHFVPCTLKIPLIHITKKE